MVVNETKKNGGGGNAFSIVLGLFGLGLVGIMLWKNNSGDVANIAEGKEENDKKDDRSNNIDMANAFKEERRKRLYESLSQDKQKMYDIIYGILNSDNKSIIDWEGLLAEFNRKLYLSGSDDKEMSNAPETVKDFIQLTREFKLFNRCRILISSNYVGKLRKENKEGMKLTHFRKVTRGKIVVFKGPLKIEKKKEAEEV